ncbi:hypothetical protein OROGR_015247 [Orobanche gracilis]
MHHELYENFRNFRIRVAYYICYRKIISNMDDRFPDATPEELNTSDATCIICREEMITAKKLICGHLFHAHCLRSWLERQNTCPTCRALVVPPENGTSSTGARGDGQQQGTSSLALALPVRLLKELQVIGWEMIISFPIRLNYKLLLILPLYMRNLLCILLQILLCGISPNIVLVHPEIACFSERENHPAADDAKSIWTEKFGFEEILQEQVCKL